MATKTARVRQASLGDIDRGDPELDDLALRYADFDAEKKAAMAEIKAMMKRKKKDHYKHGRITITTATSETARVKVDPEPAPESDG